MSKKIEELSFNELKAECKKKNINVDKTDTKELLIKKLEMYSAQTVNAISYRGNVKAKMKETKTCIVTKNDPEDVRDSTLISITNVTGSYTHVVPFNKKIELPVPIIKKLLNTKVQKFKSVNKQILGNIHEAYMDSKYIVQIIE